MSASERYSQQWREKIRKMKREAEEREKTIRTQACVITALETQVELFKDAALGE